MEAVGPSSAEPDSQTQKSCSFSACLAADPVQPSEAPPTGPHLRPRLDLQNINNGSKAPTGQNRWSKSVSTPPGAALFPAHRTSRHVQLVCSGVNTPNQNAALLLLDV